MNQQVVVRLPVRNLINVEIKRIGMFFYIFLHGVKLKRKFVTVAQAEDYLPEIHGYFGDSTHFNMKKVA